MSIGLATKGAVSRKTPKKGQGARKKAGRKSTTVLGVTDENKRCQSRQSEEKLVLFLPALLGETQGEVVNGQKISPKLKPLPITRRDELTVRRTEAENLVPLSAAKSRGVLFTSCSL